MLELIAKKIGMTHLFQESGNQTPVTIIKLYDNCVFDVVNDEGKEFTSVSIAFDKAENAKNITKPVAGKFIKKSLPIFKKLHNSRLNKDTQLKFGDALQLDSVVKKGDKINVSGITVGKGFAGVMKRWNFAGLEASHGVSVSHRSAGSVGQCQDPGRIFKGKKMAGHMGAKRATVKNLEVVMIDNEKSIIGLKGSIPGNAGSDIVLKIPNNLY